MMAPVWLQEKFVILAHEESLAEHGGLVGIRDQGLLESALARPKNLLAYAEPAPSLQQIAAAYAFGIAANHPFVDGNKRTALIACITFLKINGIRVSADKVDSYFTFLGLAAGTVSEDELAQWLTKNSSEL
jgi:death-on-curing protein